MELDFTLIDGEGIPIFFFPTFPLDRTYLEASLKDMDFKHPLVLFDYRSHGRSPNVENDKQLKFKLMADDVEELRKKLGFEKIIIFGHGLGGLIALTYVVRHMKHVDRLVLFSTSASSRFRGELAWNIRERFSPQTKNELDTYFARMDPNSLQVKFNRAYTVYFDPPNLGEAQRLLDQCHKVAYHEYYVLYPEIERFDVRPKLRKFPNPVLIVSAEKDVWPLSYVRDLQNHVKKHQLLHLEGLGHFAMIENPESFWIPIIAWINSTDN
ncbi:MAG: alpha/beta hydrolase [Methanobacteriota archaeon]|nr:MAG: alpha/beta hydrolase [Euryarchaeota archaeon]